MAQAKPLTASQDQTHFPVRSSGLPVPPASAEARNGATPFTVADVAPGVLIRPHRWIAPDRIADIYGDTDQAEAIRARDDTAAARGLAYALGLSLPVWVAVFTILYFAWQFAGRPGL